jgi:hypothetical protein
LREHLEVSMMDIPVEHIVAEGPDGLMQVLVNLLEQSKNDSAFAKEDHFILYQLGAQKSLILVDTTQIPFKLWHYDLMGRPATIAVKDTIKRFLWEKCGERDRVLQELSDRR